MLLSSSEVESESLDEVLVLLLEDDELDEMDELEEVVDELLDEDDELLLLLILLSESLVSP